MELAMDVAADDNWRPHWLYIRFLHQNLFSLFTKLFHLGLGQWFTLEKLCDLPVQIAVVKGSLHFTDLYSNILRRRSITYLSKKITGIVRIFHIYVKMKYNSEILLTLYSMKKLFLLKNATFYMNS
jgi:hypothetical protein